MAVTTAGGVRRDLPGDSDDDAPCDDATVVTLGRSGAIPPCQPEAAPAASRLRTIALTVATLVCFAANSLLCRAALRPRLVDAAMFTSIRLVSGAAALALIVILRGRARPGGGSFGAGLALFLGKSVLAALLSRRRALPVEPKQRLLREMMLQLKTGRLQTDYFERKFGADILRDYGDGFRHLQQEGFLTIGPGKVNLTRPGLLQIDRLLPTFFEAEYRGTRYT